MKDGPCDPARRWGRRGPEDQNRCRETDTCHDPQLVRSVCLAREHEAHRRAFLCSDREYGDGLPVRREAATDRQHAKVDRTHSADDRVKLTEDTVEEPDESVT